MSRFVNAALVTFMNGFVLLTILGYFLGPQGDAALSGITVTHAEWQAGDEPVLLLEVPIQNEGEGPLRATGATYEVLAGDTRLASGKAAVAALVQPGATQAVRVPVPLGTDFASRFLALYAEEGEAVQLRATGSIGLQRGEAQERLPFGWAASWKGGLAAAVAAADAPCGEADLVCVKKASLSWRDGGAVLALELRNQATTTFTVGAGQARLDLAGTGVLAGEGGDVVLAPHGSGTLRVRLEPAGGGLGDWWSGHVLRCESSPAGLVADLAVQEKGVEEAPVASQPVFLRLEAFETHIACGKAG